MSHMLRSCAKVTSGSQWEPKLPFGQKKRAADFCKTTGGFPKLRGWGTIPLRSPTWWGSNLGGGRQAGSREPVSYTSAIAPRICGWSRGFFVGKFAVYRHRLKCLSSSSFSIGNPRRNFVKVFVMRKRVLIHSSFFSTSPLNEGKKG